MWDIFCNRLPVTQHWSMLQSTKRTGWVKRGVAQPESIADHMYRMSMMGLICGADAETTTR